jgi:hypothetical protein
MRKYLCVALVFCIGSLVQAEGLLTSDQVAGKIGEMHLKLTERSPLSSLAEMAKRMDLKPDPTAADYDLSKQDFYVYVPSAPADDGKYGLLDVLPFAGGHGFAPKDQIPVLEKYHLIWIGPMNGGDDQPSQQRLGEMIDAAYNAKKIWPISERRVYAFVTSWKSPEGAVPFYYPEQFTGVVNTAQAIWFSRIKDPKSTHTTPLVFPRPRDESFALAKNLRFFLIKDTGREEVIQRLNDAVFREGYLAARMKSVKMLPVDGAKCNIWSNFTGDWLEEAIQYLDEGPTRAPVASATRSTTTASSHPSAAAAPLNKEDQANHALSLAKSYVSSGSYAIARTKLQKIIDEYPGTKAAGEAKKLLEEIKDK